MSLHLEVRVPGENLWISAAIVNPGEQPGSISNNLPDGRRELYSFECAKDNSRSVIYRSSFGIDIALEFIRINTTEGLEPIKELRKGYPPYELKVKTDSSPEVRSIRFTHF